MQRFDLILMATMVIVATFVFNRCDQPARSENLKPPVPDGITLEADTARIHGFAVVRTGPSGYELIDTIEPPENHRRWLKQNEFDFEYITIDSTRIRRVDSLGPGASIVPGELVYSKDEDEQGGSEKEFPGRLDLI